MVVPKMFAHISIFTEDLFSRGGEGFITNFNH